MSAKYDPQRIVEAFADQLKTAYGNGLYGVMLVGSAARGDYLPGKSDINTLVILTPEAINHLEKAFPILKAFHGRNLAPPFFMTPDTVTRSLDSYPLEFLDFKLFHHAILGSDPLQDISIPKQPLRLQIERELRGKLLLLRQIYAVHAHNNKDLRMALQRAGKLFTAIFQGILELADRPIPADRPTMFRQAADCAAVSDQVFQRLLAVRQGSKKENFQELFKTLLIEIDKLVAWIDSYTIS